jgi:hypothetical protein
MTFGLPSEEIIQTLFYEGHRHVFAD